MIKVINRGSDNNDYLPFITNVIIKNIISPISESAAISHFREISNNWCSLYCWYTYYTINLSKKNEYIVIIIVIIQWYSLSDLRVFLREREGERREGEEIGVMIGWMKREGTRMLTSKGWRQLLPRWSIIDSTVISSTSFVLFNTIITTLW